MLFKNYEYFFAIVQEGSISKAAEKLFISQPSLSKYLKRLEDSLGVSLFSRECYPLQLTEAGMLYLNYVKEATAAERNLKRDFEKINKSIRGGVTIGMTVWRSSVVIPQIFSEFRARYPDIHLSVQEGSHQQIATLLENDKVDFSIMHLPNRYGNFMFEHLCYERVFFAVNRKNPLLLKFGNIPSNGIIRIPIEAFSVFQHEDFIMLKSGQNLRETVQNFLYQLNIAPNIIFETSNIITAINMVGHNAGVTFVQEKVLETTSSSADIVLFEIDSPLLRWDLSIAYKENNRPSRPARCFIDYMKENHLLTP